MFIGNFQGIYEHPSTAETLKTIKQKHDESFWDYVKHFCNARNTISYIQDIEIINAFHDGVSDIKNMEEIAMKKPKTVADLLAVADVCIEASEAQAQLLESHGKGPSKKKQDNREVNMTDWGGRKDLRDHNKKSSDQKEKKSFRCPDDTEKWCEIYHTGGHDLKECKTFVVHKKLPPPAAPTSQEPHRGKYHRVNPDDNEQMGEMNVIFGGSMSIASKTQGKKLKREISLAQRIEPGRMMKWSDVDISFGPEDHIDTKLSERNLPFVVKLAIERHKVAKTLIDNRASLNLVMRKTFIEMGINLSDLTPIHDTFHRVILGKSSTPIGCINQEVSCGTGDNKQKEMLTFEVASFDIGYNCILGTPFLPKFMVVIHTVNAMMKMPDPKGVITIKASRRDALACENATLTHA
jgi:hypothetical protein